MLTILWLDNDVAQTDPYVHELQRRGHAVQVVKRIAECEDLLNAAFNGARYDMLILDVMIPTKDAAEEERYDPVSTDRGNITGLAFWKQWRQRLAEMSTKVLVLTVRLDRTIKQQFLAAALPIESFATKLQLREVSDFVKRVEQIASNDK